MKNILTVFLCTFFYASSFACSCENIPSFCQVSKYISDSEVGIIFVGELMEVDSIDEFSSAYKLKIVDKLYGDVILSDSPHFVDNGYDNTTDEVWVLGGESSLCMREIANGLTVIACNYEQNFGYFPGICEYNYLEVDDNNMLTGYISDQFSLSTIHLDELRDVVAAPCISSTEELENLIASEVQITPIPFDDVLNINSSLSFSTQVKYELTDLNGRVIAEAKLESGNQMIQTAAIRSGVYFIRFTDGEDSVVRKVVKM